MRFKNKNLKISSENDLLEKPHALFPNSVSCASVQNELFSKKDSFSDTDESRWVLSRFPRTNTENKIIIVRMNYIIKTSTSCHYSKVLARQSETTTTVSERFTVIIIYYNTE